MSAGKTHDGQFTPQQQTAIGSPCYESWECSDQKFRRCQQVGRWLLSTLLTVNVGEE